MKDRAGCEACHMTGWILYVKDDGQPTARPCTCLYEIAKKLLADTNKAAFKDAGYRKFAEETVRAYDRHKEKEKNDA